MQINCLLVWIQLVKKKERERWHECCCFIPFLNVECVSFSADYGRTDCGFWKVSEISVPRLFVFVAILVFTFGSSITMSCRSRRRNATNPTACADVASKRFQLRWRRLPTAAGPRATPSVHLPSLFPEWWEGFVSFFLLRYVLVWSPVDGTPPSVFFYYCYMISPSLLSPFFFFCLW